MPLFVSQKPVLRHAALAVVLVAAAASYATAQSNNPPSIGVGLKSGVQFPIAEGSDNPVGSAIGVFVDYNSGGHIGVVGDVLFVMTPESHAPGTPSGRFDYFQVPVMARVRGGVDGFGAYGIAGPAFNLKLSGDDAYESQTVDFVFGGGVEIKNAMIEARLARGNRDFTFGSVTTSVTQKTFQLLVAFRLR